MLIDTNSTTIHVEICNPVNFWGAIFDQYGE